MLTRRAFLAAGALPLTRIPLQRAARYDLLIKGGRVIDPGRGRDGVADVAIRGGRIAAVQTDIADSLAADVLDARGKLVTPGLIDLHVHVGAPDLTPAALLPTGVTSMIDGGSRGADNVAELVRIAQSAPNRVRIFLNLARTGIAPEGELMNLDAADVDAARRAIALYRGWIVGVKARLSERVAGERDVEAVRRARAAAGALPIMLHIGQTFSPLPKILALLKPGDIVTHVYSPPPHGVLDEHGRILPEVLEARRRGIRFDVGNGRTGHITWEVAEAAAREGFWPDTISSDITGPGRTFRVFDFPTVISKFLLLGMPLGQTIACATVNAARSLSAFRDLGTLGRGAAADVAVFDLREGDFEFLDNADGKRIGHHKLLAHAVVMGGKAMTATA